MKVAIYQGEGRPARVDENIETIRRSAFSAAQQGADLIIFPELFLTGYNIGSAAHELAEPAGGPSSLKAAEIAGSADIAMLYGYSERYEADVYNSALLIDRKGRARASYRKAHLYGSYEKKYFKPGNQLLLVELDGLNIGILICYDVEFPEAVRALVKAGADLIAVPTALMEDYCRVAEKVVPARAYESEIYVAYVNRCGSEGDIIYCGRSCLVGPDGREVLRAGLTEALLVADIDKKAIAEAREKNPVLKDLRPDLYAMTVARM